MENQDPSQEQEDSPTLSTPPPPILNPLGQNLSSSTTAVSPTHTLDLISELSTTAALPSSSAAGLSLSLGLSSGISPPRCLNQELGSAAAALRLGPSSAVVPSPPGGLDLSLGQLSGGNAPSGSQLRYGSAAAALRLGPSSAVVPSPPEGLDLSLGQLSGGNAPSGSQDPTSSTVQKAIHIPMNKITIGEWTQIADNSRDLLAKIYFGLKQFIWEITHPIDGGRKRLTKMVIDWTSVLSLKVDGECFEIELNKAPRFIIENKDPHDISKWKQIDHFAPGHPSSTCRRHALYFDHQVLKTNFEKIMADTFWSNKIKVQFPSLRHSLLFTDAPVDDKTGEKRKFDEI